MRVKVSDRKYLRDLLLFLRECGCVAEQASQDEADVYAPAARNGHAAREEVGIYIAAWRIKSGGNAEIHRVDRPHDRVV
jgi:hypothetical protein